MPRAIRIKRIKDRQKSENTSGAEAVKARGEKANRDNG